MYDFSLLGHLLQLAIFFNVRVPYNHENQSLPWDTPQMVYYSFRNLVRHNLVYIWFRKSIVEKERNYGKKNRKDKVAKESSTQRRREKGHPDHKSQDDPHARWRNAKERSQIMTFAKNFERGLVVLRIEKFLKVKDLTKEEIWNGITQSFLYWRATTISNCKYSIKELNYLPLFVHWGNWIKSPF